MGVNDADKLNKNFIGNSNRKIDDINSFQMAGKGGEQIDLQLATSIHEFH